jgi:alpha-beta hydrolase superfamily lysophospholipase
VGTFFILGILAGVFLTEATLHPGRRAQFPAEDTRARKIAAQYDSDLSEVSILAGDHATLRAWSLHPRHGNGNAIVAFHGIGDNRSGMLAYAEIFLHHGYDVLMPDARAHGTSEGALATFGLWEADDTRRWLSWLQSYEHPDCIYGFAESMGAAGLLQSLHQEPFCAVVAESPFSSFREVAYDRVAQFFRTGPWLGRTILRPVVDFAFIYAKWKYKLDFEQVSPENSVAVAKVPVLLIHGQLDRNIPVRHSRRIAARNSSIVLWEVPGADHCGAIGIALAEFERRVITWFELNNHRNSAAKA